ncbi:MAG TPA: hypothetical protein VK283_05220 [Acidimicrobiales bacterium]|nr:hypothetical protein [Acidimicrobiales bacterium]
MTIETAENKGSGGAPTRRWALVGIAVIGVALAVMPLAFNMFGRTPKGAVMIAGFKPYMISARLSGYQSELREIDAGVRQTDTTVAAYLGGGSPDRATFEADYPNFTSFDQQWPAIDSKMTGLMNEVQANLGNYLAVAALPSFRLFPWFFVIPGLLIAAFAIAALVRSSQWRANRWVLVALGVGLIAAPGVFQMFQRAPDGGRMMSAFENIETSQNVQQIQGYFGSMAVGQGAIRLEIVPAIEGSGLDASQISARFPAVASLDANWVHIVNDMTPMIGAMSDNVANYQAIASLPPFPLFPWFFVLPGLLVIGLSVAGGVTRPRLGFSGASDGPPIAIPVNQGVS